MAGEAPAPQMNRPLQRHRNSIARTALYIMSDLTYIATWRKLDAEALGLAPRRGQNPTFSPDARIEAGFLLARLQEGEPLSITLSRPLPVLGPRCHELRVADGKRDLRIIYRLDQDAVVILEFFSKKTQRTPAAVLRICRERMHHYDAI
jgi:phage-related protein